MRFAVGDSGTFLDAIKGGLFGAAFDSGFGGGALGAAGLYDPTKGLVGTAFDKGLGGGALGAAGLYEPMKGVLGTDSGFADFIKKGGALGAAGVYDPMKGVVGDSNPFGNFGGGLGAIGGMFGNQGTGRGFLRKPVEGLGGLGGLGGGLGAIGGMFSKGGNSSGSGGLSASGFLGSFLGA